MTATTVGTHRTLAGQRYVDRMRLIKQGYYGGFLEGEHTTKDVIVQDNRKITEEITGNIVSVNQNEEFVFLILDTGYQVLLKKSKIEKIKELELLTRLSK